MSLGIEEIRPEKVPPCEKLFGQVDLVLVAFASLDFRCLHFLYPLQIAHHCGMLVNFYSQRDMSTTCDVLTVAVGRGWHEPGFDQLVSGSWMGS